MGVALLLGKLLFTRSRRGVHMKMPRLCPSGSLNMSILGLSYKASFVSVLENVGSEIEERLEATFPWARYAAMSVSCTRYKMLIPVQNVYISLYFIEI